MQYIAPLAKLIEHFRALPGIGSKTAVRLAYHVLDMDAAKARALAEHQIEPAVATDHLIEGSEDKVTNAILRWTTLGGMSTELRGA